MRVFEHVGMLRLHICYATDPSNKWPNFEQKCTKTNCDCIYNFYRIINLQTKLGPRVFGQLTRNPTKFFCNRYRTTTRVDIRLRLTLDWAACVNAPEAYRCYNNSAENFRVQQSTYYCTDCSRNPRFPACCIWCQSMENGNRQKINDIIILRLEERWNSMWWV